MSTRHFSFHPCFEPSPDLGSLLYSTVDPANMKQYYCFLQRVDND